MYWLKQLKDKTLSIATAIDCQPQYIEYAKRGKYAYNNMLSHSFMRLSKHQYAASGRFNDSWRRLPGYLQGK